MRDGAVAGDGAGAGAPARADGAPDEGTVLAGWRLVAPLEAAGAGVTWRAESARGEAAAVKILRAELRGLPGAEDAFLSDARAARLLRHEGRPAVLELGRAADGSPFVVTELLTGESLAELLARVGRLSEADAVKVIVPLAAALGAEHARGEWHGDLKPRSVMLAVDAGRREPRVKVLGFGTGKMMARWAAQRAAAGAADPREAGYLAPEQCAGPVTAIDFRADVYALGAIIYHLLAGHPPFVADSADEVRAMHRTEPPPPLRAVDPAFSASVEGVVLRALAKDPSARYASAEELASALRMAAGGGRAGVGAAPAEGPRRALPAMRARAEGERARERAGDLETEVAVSAPAPPRDRAREAAVESLERAMRAAADARRATATAKAAGEADLRAAGGNKGWRNLLIMVALLGGVSGLVAIVNSGGAEDDALAEARRAIDDRDWDTALRALEAAHADGPDADELYDRALSGARAKAAYGRFRTFVDAGDDAGAYREGGTLDHASPYWTDAEPAWLEARARLAAKALEDAQLAATRGDVAAARAAVAAARDYGADAAAIAELEARLPRGDGAGDSGGGGGSGGSGGGGGGGGGRRGGGGDDGAPGGGADDGAAGGGAASWGLALVKALRTSPGVKRCLKEAASRADPMPDSFLLKIALEIDADGSLDPATTKITDTADVLDAPGRACLLKAIGKLHFPPPPSGEPTKLKVPLRYDVGS